mmetsp:Transcript_20466/g.62310  ORF Transcript_20466/g.62310 Transcript_20466/m.62310 type:complete len:238 (+) Transcript_20466:166-879(+)
MRTPTFNTGQPYPSLVIRRQHLDVDDVSVDEVSGVVRQHLDVRPVRRVGEEEVEERVVATPVRGRLRGVHPVLPQVLRERLPVHVALLLRELHAQAARVALALEVPRRVLRGHAVPQLDGGEDLLARKRQAQPRRRHVQRHVALAHLALGRRHEQVHHVAVLLPAEASVAAAMEPLAVEQRLRVEVAAAQRAPAGPGAEPMAWRGEPRASQGSPRRRERPRQRRRRRCEEQQQQQHF